MKPELTFDEKKLRRWALMIIRRGNPNEPDEGRISPVMVEHAADVLDRLEEKR